MLTVDGAGARDNNFNFLRLAAASLVIVAHGIELPTGLVSHDFAHTITGHSLGWYAVSIFFAISGYLVLGSWDRSPSLISFVRNRGLRIWPGLVVMLVLTVSALGLWLGTLAPRRFFTDPQTWSYLFGGISVINVRYPLPGVFNHNPISAVNGSLWTLRHEIACYFALAGLGALGLLAQPVQRRILLAALTLIAAGTSVVVAESGSETTGRILLLAEFSRLSFGFLLGALFRDWRDSVPLRLPVLAALVLLAALAVRTTFFVPLAILALAYATFWIAFVPNMSWLRAARRMPDYSYGLYIYAFPIQQAIIATVPEPHPAIVILLGFALTLPPAALSWHCIEEPMLRLKSGPRRLSLFFSFTKADHAS